jgi:hypothetical protein
LSILLRFELKNKHGLTRHSFINVFSFDEKLNYLNVLFDKSK